MLEEHAKIVQFIACSRWNNWTQKITKNGLHCKKDAIPLKKNIEFHIYGPYSEELTLRVEELMQYGIFTRRTTRQRFICTI